MYALQGWDISGMPVYGVGAPIQLANVAQPRGIAYPPMAPMNAAPMQAPPMIVRETAPSEGLLIPLALKTAATVAATGGTGSATANPQNACTPVKLSVPDELAPQFDVFPLFIGTSLQGLENTSMPASCFRGDSNGTNITCTTAQQNSIISQSVVNNGNVATQYKATLFCKAAR